MDEDELLIMNIISSAGDSKAKAIDALKQVRTGDFDQARKLLQESKEVDLEAHRAQTELITSALSDRNRKPEMSLLMVHAQDHYMMAQLARDLIEELIAVFEAREERDRQ